MTKLGFHLLSIFQGGPTLRYVALSQFRQEVRLARRITHPNIRRTSDIQRPQASPFDSWVTLTTKFGRPWHWRYILSCPAPGRPGRE
jgi:hypothetical protein